MARKIRMFLEKVSQNVIIRGNNNQNIFLDEEDYEHCYKIVESLTATIDIHIHSFVFMPTHIHFFCTPLHQDSLSKFMQNLGRLYVRYFNMKYNRTGTLWDGRFKSSLVEDMLYMFDIMKYIEQNPLRAKTVKSLDTYKYSSYCANALNKNDNITKQHILYKGLADSKSQRCEKYLEIFNVKIKNEKLDFIRANLNKQMITGSIGFVKNLEKLVGTALLSKQRGRPKQINKKRKDMYNKLVVLDKVEHKDIRIKPMKDLSFAKDLSFVPVVANEVGLVGKDFPVVFSGGENPSLMTLISLGGSNLALNEENKWITSYVPLNLRKYPFSMASTEENKDQKIILIDEESPLVNKKEGTLIFKKDVDQTDMLKNAVKFLQETEIQNVTTLNIAKTIADSGILEDREITIGEGDEKKVFVNGFKVVNKEKLNELSDEVLADWVRRGIIGFIDAHVNSLNNIQSLFDLASKKQ